MADPDWRALAEARKRGDHRVVLDALLETWREGDPAPWLADLIDAASDAVLAEEKRVLTGQGRRREEWFEVEAEGDPVDLPRLASVLVDATPTRGRELLQRLAARGSDPRLSGILASWCFDPPERHRVGCDVLEPPSEGEVRQWWTLVVGLLVETRDVRVMPTLRRRLEGLEAMRAFDAVTEGVLHQRLPAALEALEALPEREEPRGAALLRRRHEPVVDPVEALRKAVYADPRDDEPRWVLADVLQERGDPQGTFIALQLKDATSDEGLSDEERARMKALLTDHGQAWLGPLARVVNPKKVRFERGFLAACEIHGHRYVHSIADMRELGTVERLELRTYGDTALFRRGYLRAVRALRGRCGEVMSAGRPLPVERIEVDEYIPGALWEFLVGCANFPNLRHLDLNPLVDADPVETFRRTVDDRPRLESLGLTVDLLGEGVHRWRSFGRAAELKRLTLRSPEGSSVELGFGRSHLVTVHWIVSGRGESRTPDTRSVVRLGDLLDSELLLASDDVQLHLTQPRFARRRDPVPETYVDALRRRLEGRCASLRVFDDLAE